MNKVTYTDRVTVIPASNMNEIQDAINANESSISALQDNVASLESIAVITPTTSGAIAHFPDGANLPVSELIVGIDPIQSGSGTPSPTNVRPISGHTAVNVYRTGKNLIPYPYFYSTRTQNGITFTDNGDGTVTANGTATAGTNFWMASRTDSDFLLPAGDYIISNNADYGSATTYQVSVNATIDGANQVIGRSYSNGGRFTVPDNATSIGIYIGISNGATVTNKTFRPMLRLASDTDDTWESPVNNIAKSIGLGRTVYGGQLNLTTGELTVDTAYVEYDGSSDENWTIGSASTYKRFIINLSGAFTDSPRHEVMCNRGVYRASGNDDGTVFTSVGNLYYYANSITTVADFKTWLASNPLQVVYELATPLTYTLTATEIETLLGENNIWADSGDIVSVTYKADTKLYIDNKLA